MAVFFVLISHFTSYKRNLYLSLLLPSGLQSVVSFVAVGGCSLAMKEERARDPGMAREGLPGVPGGGLLPMWITSTERMSSPSSSLLSSWASLFVSLFAFLLLRLLMYARTEIKIEIYTRKLSNSLRYFSSKRCTYHRRHCSKNGDDHFDVRELVTSWWVAPVTRTLADLGSILLRHHRASCRIAVRKVVVVRVQRARGISTGSIHRFIVC